MADLTCFTLADDSPGGMFAAIDPLHHGARHSDVLTLPPRSSCLLNRGGRGSSGSVKSLCRRAVGCHPYSSYEEARSVDTGPPPPPPPPGSLVVPAGGCGARFRSSTASLFGCQRLRAGSPSSATFTGTSGTGESAAARVTLLSPSSSENNKDVVDEQPTAGLKLLKILTDYVIKIKW